MDEIYSTYLKAATSHFNSKDYRKCDFVVRFMLENGSCPPITRMKALMLLSACPGDLTGANTSRTEAEALWRIEHDKTPADPQLAIIRRGLDALEAVFMKMRNEAMGQQQKIQVQEAAAKYGAGVDTVTIAPDLGLAAANMEALVEAAGGEVNNGVGAEEIQIEETKTSSTVPKPESKIKKTSRKITKRIGVLIKGWLNTPKARTTPARTTPAPGERRTQRSRAYGGMWKLEPGAAIPTSRTGGMLSSTDIQRGSRI